MRKAYFDISIPRDAEGRVLGVILGHDFTAEHEWGINKLLNAFGVTDNPCAVGVKKRKATIVPSGLMWTKIGKRAGILLPPPCRTASKEGVNVTLSYWKDFGLSTHKPGLAAAWDEDSFLITSDDKEDIKALKEVYDACVGLDIAVALLSPQAWLGNNLGLVIISRMPKEIIDLWKSHDKERNWLQSYMKKSHIEELLKNNKRGYFALSPHRQKDGSVQFWLNPMQQNENNFGWFTLQDLREWAQGKGKIPKFPPKQP